MSDLALFFESRETRLGRLPEKARSAFQAAEEAATLAGDTEFADRQFAGVWLSRRLGIPHKQVMDNFEGVARNFFGEGATGAKAWDAIAATYKPAGGEGGEAPVTSAAGETAGNEAEWAETGALARMGKGVLLANLEQAGRSMFGGAGQTLWSAVGGLFSQLATFNEAQARPTNPFADARYAALAERRAALLNPPHWPHEFPKELNAAEMAQLKEINDEISALVARADTDNRERLKAYGESAQPEITGRWRGMAKGLYELSAEVPKLVGVDPAFAQTTVGQFAAAAGSVPATAALALLGPGGWVGMESLFYGQVEQERMAKEGADYVPAEAAGANLAAALPQMLLEKAFGVERLMNKVLRVMPKEHGMVRFGDFLRQVVRGGLASGVEEGLTEPAQGFWNDFIASITYDVGRELFTEEAAKERLVEAVAGFGLGVLFGGGVTGVALRDQQVRANRADAYLTSKSGELLTPHDFQALRVSRTDEEILAAAGDDVEQGKLLLAAANGDASAQAKYVNDVKAAKFVDTEGVDIGGVQLGTVDGVVVLRDADGLITPVDMSNPSHREAVERLKALAVRVKTTEETLAGLQERHGDTMQGEIAAAMPSLQDRVAAGLMTQEQADEAVEIAKLVNGLAQDATAASVAVQGTADVAQTTEGVWQMIVKVARAADPTVAIEEVAESWIKRAYRQEQLVPADLNEARVRWHAEQGEADVGAGLEGEALERANVEWFSKRVIEYAVANRETVLPGGWGAWLRTLGEKLKEFLRGATRMRKLMRDGRLDPELEAWMKGALGLQGQAESFGITGERAAAQAARGNAEAAPVVDEVDEEMMATATADTEFPKITRTDAGDFLVQAFDGSMIGSRPTIEGAQQMALEWFDRWAREQERQTAKAESGQEAANEIINVVQRVGGLPAPSVEPTFAGELRAIRESLGTARALRVFRKNAGDLDYVRQAVNEQGFAFETVTEFLDALDRSARGEAVFGMGGEQATTFSVREKNEDMPQKTPIARWLWNEVVRMGGKPFPFDDATGGYTIPKSFVGYDSRWSAVWPAIDALENRGAWKNLKNRIPDAVWQVGLARAQRLPISERPMALAWVLRETIRHEPESKTYYDPFANFFDPEYTGDARVLGNDIANNARDLPEYNNHKRRVLHRLAETLADPSRKLDFDALWDIANPQRGDIAAGGEYGDATAAAVLHDIAQEITRHDSIFESLLETEVNAVQNRDSGGGEAVGEDLTFALAPAVESEAFKAWFGDSKVVDAQDKPLVVFHGTDSDFTRFDIRKAGLNTDSEWGDLGELGFWFTPSAKGASEGTVASFDGGRLLPVYLRIVNPFTVELGTLRSRRKFAGYESGDPLDTLQKLAAEHGGGARLRAVLKKKGYDGIRLVGADDMMFQGADQWVAFSSSQIKSATGNRGTFDPNNPDITFALTGVPQNAQQQAQATAQALRARQLAATQAMAQRLAAGYKAKHVKAVRLTTQATIRSRLLMPVYSRLAIISPKLAQRLRRFEYDNGIALRDAFKRVEPFLQGLEKMRDADRETLDLALKNSDEQTRNQLLAAYRLTQAFADVEALIADLADKAEAAGFSFERVSGAYFPRHVNDLDGLRAFYHLTPKGGVIEEALKKAADAAAAQGRILTPEETGAIVNATLQQPPGQGATPGNLKQRKIDIVDPGASQFYAGTAEALILYIERMNSAIQKRAFFGKALVTMQAQNGGTYQSNAIAVDASVGKVVEDLIAAGEMTRQQQAETVAMLQARFNQQASGSFVRGFKALSYMSTMGQVTSAMTQLTDLAFSMYENGVYETMVAAARAVTRTSPITRDSVGLDRIAEEFRDTGKLHKALDRVFRITGIHFMDMIGKETIMNAKFAQLAKQAKAGRLSAKARAMIDASFGPSAARVIGDLAARRKNEDTLFAVYSILADYQPINLSEYPEAYLRHPNGRIFYMLKTFTIKQLDSVRREALSLIVHGNAKQKALGFKNLIHLCGLLFLIGMPVDWLKDFVMNRDPYLPDIAVDNLFKMLGVNRWNMYQFRERKNPVEAALLLVAPPAPFFVYPGQDVMAAAQKIAEGDEIKPMEFESWRILPFFGAPIYWYAGGGPAKVEKRRTRREREAMLLRGS